jgi:hypothetical protein
MAPHASDPWKMPPVVKVLEAFGAIGDNRVTLVDEQKATVRSSEGDKIYDVEISTDGREVSSNDNASYWQGYLGYPAIAVMLMRGLLPLDKAVISALSGIAWREVNRQFRNDYPRTVAYVLEIAAERGVNAALIRKQADEVLAGLQALAPVRVTRRRPPRSSRRPSTSDAPATSPAQSGRRPRSRNSPH